jgi:WD40 repeat protein
MTTTVQSQPPTITPLATLTPPSNTRTWLSSPHPHSPILATACSDRSARIYSLTSFTLLSTITGGHKRSIRSVAWKPDSGTSASRAESVLATGSFDASAGIWRRSENAGGVEKDEVDFTKQAGHDDDEWRFAVVLDGHESEIKSLAFSPTSPLLATCSRDKSVWIWEELEDDNFETVAVLQEHEGDVKCVCWHPTEELLASSSYDDNIRLWREDVDDWACCALLSGHKGTVWWVEFEGALQPCPKLAIATTTTASAQQNLLQLRQAAGPRLVSCSDDLTIRIWRRIPKANNNTMISKTAPKIPSIIKTDSIQEEWIHEATLPQHHERAIYSVSWSKVTGRIASTGSDGKIIVYEERWPVVESCNTVVDTTHGSKEIAPTEWVAVAEVENAHDVFEINHVCWAKRRDAGRRDDDEEILISTGDDGEVRVWTLENFT